MITDEDLLLLTQPKDAPSDDWLNTLIAQEMAKEQPPQPGAAEEPDPRARARELAAQRQASAPTGPGDAENAFTSAVDKPREDNMWLAVLGQLLTGHDYMGDRAAHRQQYQQGLLQARAQDAAARKAGRPVDAGTAELGTLAGLSPESAAGLNEDSPALKLFNNLGMITTRQRGQDLAAQQKAEQIEARTSDLEKKLAAQKEIAGGKNETTLERQRIANEPHRAHGHGKKGKGGGGAPRTPEQIAQEQQDELNLNAAYLADSAQAGGGKGVTLEQAQAFLSGSLDPSAVPPEALERMKKDAIFLKGLKSGEPKKYYELIKGGAGREAGNVDKPAVAAAVKIADPKERLKLRDDVSSVGQDIAAADRAWKSLSPAARDALAKLGGQGGFIAGQLQKLAMSEQDQAAKAQLQALANTLIKARAGSAVTGTEWNRVAAEIGFAQEDFDALNSPASIEAWLAKTKRAWSTHVKNIKAEYPGLWGSDGGT